MRRSEHRGSRRPAAYPASSTRRRRPFVDADTLPASYNTTQVTLIARDPYWIHAYWDIAPDSVRAAEARLGNGAVGAAFVLRMYDVTAVDFDGSNANHWFDVEVGAEARDWYVNLWCDNVAYCAEIGLRASDGRFCALARSNVVMTPRASASPRTDLIWMEVRPDRRRLPFVMADRAHLKRGQAAAPQESLSPEAKKARRRIYLTEDDIRAYYARLVPLLRRLRRRKNEKRERKETSSRPGPALRWLSSGLGERAPLPGLTGYGTDSPLLVGASERGRRLGGASESVAGSLGSGRASAPGRTFFFEVRADLIVYGRTEPDAVVRLGDRRIALRPDGTFTLRYALPDGRIPFPFSAVSVDGLEERRIRTAVERERTIRETRTSKEPM